MLFFFKLVYRKFLFHLLPAQYLIFEQCGGGHTACDLWELEPMPKIEPNLFCYGSNATIVEQAAKNISHLNTQNMTNATIVSPVKMEYGWNFSISGLKMMVKSGLEKIFLKFLHALTIFY